MTVEDKSAPVASSSPGPDGFARYHEVEPEKANVLLNKLIEITGRSEKHVLFQALDATKKGAYEYSLPDAIDWLLSYEGHAPNPPEAMSKQLVPVVQQGNKQQPESMSTPSPASPAVIDPATPQGPINKPLVDLTEGPTNGAPAVAPAPAPTGDEDLQKAIRLSLQENRPMNATGLSQEEQDVSRALEASLLDTNPGGTKRKRGDTWIDPLNPHDRERQGLWPVGLKNVGQTCWFSAVIQSLFYLPAFRTLVLNFKPLSNSHLNPKIVDFMQELRKLFSLMICSQRKYVDPSTAVDILKDALFGNNIDNNQQDVSEFTHKVLEWVEEAFKNPSVETTKQEPMDEEEKHEKETFENSPPSTVEEILVNPMSRLFYGQVLVEGKNNGTEFSRTEAFGQWPLGVTDVTDIHESIENSTAHEYFDTGDQGGSKSGQERWFTRLPPVLFFELSRFQYNHKRNAAEKVHSRLAFPELIYMDRYMTVNKNITRSKREEVRVLKERREVLSSRLSRFTSYGSGTERLPLQMILQYSMEFAGSAMDQTVAPDQTHEDHSMSSPPSNVIAAAGSNTTSTSTLMQVDSPCPSPKMTPASSLTNVSSIESSATTSNRLSIESSGTKDDFVPMDIETTTALDQQPSCETTGNNSSNIGVDVPRPKHASELELRVIHSCLSRWKQEVETDIATLDDSIREIDNMIQTMYSEPSLNKLEYRLHAVMVHEGSVDSGHYWAYVLDHRRKVWLKFNDNSVTDASWEELVKESFGGNSNTSAYSLVYIDTSKPELFGSDFPIGEQREDSMEESEFISLAEHLPTDMAEYVVADNNAFRDEVVKWDQEQELRKLEAATVANMGSASEGHDVQVVQEKLTYVNTHAKLAFDKTNLIIKVFEGELKRIDADSAMTNAANKMLTHWKERALLQDESALIDVRLESFIIYLLRNRVKPDGAVIFLALYEQFSLPGVDSDGPVAKTFRQLAEKNLLHLRNKFKDEAAALREWHQTYHNFRLSVHSFVSGLEDFTSHKFEKCLDLLTFSFTTSRKVADSPPKAENKTLRTRMIMKYIRLSVKEVNHSLIKQFKLGERLDEVIKQVRYLVVPVLILLEKRIVAQPESGSDKQCLEDVRGQWCALLGDQDMPQDSLTEVLSIVLEPPPEACPTLLKFKNSEFIELQADLKLGDRYSNAVKNASEMVRAALDQQPVKS